MVYVTKTIENITETQLTSVVKGVLTTNGIHDERVLAALCAVDREQFVPQSKQHVAYVDEDIPLCENRYLLNILVFAKLLTYADINDDHHVLDVGAGLGYTSCVIKQLCAQVTATEESAELTATTRKKLANCNVECVNLVTSPIDAGSSTHQPYDRIIVEGAIADIPSALEDQLKESGKIVAIRSTGNVFATKKALGDIIIGTKHNGKVSYVEKERVSAYPLRKNFDDNSFKL